MTSCSADANCSSTRLPVISKGIPPGFATRKMNWPGFNGWRFTDATSNAGASSNAGDEAGGCDCAEVHKIAATNTRPTLVRIVRRELRSLSGLFHHAAVKQVNVAIRVASIAGIVRHHTYGSAAAMQFAKQIHHRFAIRRVQI